MAVKTLNKTVFQAFPNLETERFYLTAFYVNKQEDVQTIFRLKSDPVIMKYMDRDPYVKIQEARANIRKLDKWFKKSESIQWAIRPKDTGIAIGSFCFWNIRFDHCRAEIGYSLFPEYWQKGIITEVGRKILHFGFELFELHSIDANINPENGASRAVLLKMGFHKESYRRQDYQYNGLFLDSEAYGLLHSDFIS